MPAMQYSPDQLAPDDLQEILSTLTDEELLRLRRRFERARKVRLVALLTDEIRRRDE